MINPDLVFDSVRRGYQSLEEATNDEIIHYFEGLEPDVMVGHVSNIKGILFEQVYMDELVGQGIQAGVYELTNHPGADLFVLEDGQFAYELQMKATDSIAYIDSALQSYPDVAIVATSEVANSFESDMVIDAGIENAVLEETVSQVLIEEAVNPLSGFSLLRFLIGLPF